MVDVVAGLPVAGIEADVTVSMDRAAAVRRIQRGLGWRSNLEYDIIMSLQEAQRDLERGKSLPEFLLVEDATLTVTAGTGEIALPTNFLRRSSHKLRYTLDNSDKPQFVEWRNLNEALAQWGGADSRSPQVVVLRNSTLLFYPERDKPYTVTWSYYKKDAVLSTNIQNLWLQNAPELLIGLAGMSIAADAKNSNALATFTNMYKMARQTWFNEIVVQEMDDGPLIMGANN